MAKWTQVKTVIMKNTIFILAILFLFGCKKETVKQMDGIDLTGKIKSITFEEVKSIFTYNDTTGKLRFVSYFYSDKEYIISFDRNKNKIYFYYNFPSLYNDYFDLTIEEGGLIKSFKSWNGLDSRNYYNVNFTNKLNYYTDAVDNPLFGGSRYYNIKSENGNYVSCLFKYIPFLSGGLMVDTINYTYTNLAYNKYAPLQKLLLTEYNVIDYLGYDDNFLFPQNKNLIKSMSIKTGNTEYVNEYDYEFDGLNQLVKMKITNLAGVREYIMEYY
jgi:hypothetical protein